MFKDTLEIVVKSALAKKALFAESKFRYLLSAGLAGAYVLIFWMLFAFIASGYEHSIANMTVLGLALLLPHPETITIAGLFHNMIPVTLGNIVGGALFVGTAYWLISAQIKA